MSFYLFLFILSLGLSCILFYALALCALICFVSTRLQVKVFIYSLVFASEYVYLFLLRLSGVVVFVHILFVVICFGVFFLKRRGVICVWMC